VLIVLLFSYFFLKVKLGYRKLDYIKLGYNKLGYYKLDYIRLELNEFCLDLAIF